MVDPREHFENRCCHPSRNDNFGSDGTRRTLRGGATFTRFGLGGGFTSFSTRDGSFAASANRLALTPSRAFHPAASLNMWLLRGPISILMKPRPRHCLMP